GAADDPAEIGDVRFDEVALSRIRRLKRPDGSGMLVYAVELFRRSAQDALQKMQTAIDEDDATALRFNAHKLKSGCTHVGAIGLATLCRQLEELGERGTTIGAAQIFAQLIAHHAVAVSWLEEQVRAA